MAESFAHLLTQSLSMVAELETRATNMKAAIAAGSISSASLIQFHDRIQDYRDAVADLADLATLNDIADANLATGKPADLKAKLGGVRTAAGAVSTWLRSNFPVSNGFLLAVIFNPTTGRTEYRSFTAAQVSGLVALLDDLIAAAG